MRLLLLWRVLLFLEAGQEEEEEEGEGVGEAPNLGGESVRQRMGLHIGTTLQVACRNGIGLNREGEREGGREGGKAWWWWLWLILATECRSDMGQRKGWGGGRGGKEGGINVVVALPVG